jgi:hypothetical protein
MSEETAITLIKIGGGATTGWLIFHLLFWRLFGWRRQLRKLDLVNGGIMQVLNLCLSLVFLIFAIISLWFAEELLRTALGQVMLAGMSVFWLLRLIEQPVFFGFSKASTVFSLLFILMTALYAAPLLFT